MTSAASNLLSGAVALVTGAGGAIGRAACEALTKEGVQVIGTNVSGMPNGLSNVWLQQDVTSKQDWRAVADRIRDQFGRLDCLVNSAGICVPQRISEISLEEWRKVAAVNVESILLGMQACLPLLRESGVHRAGGASIVNLSSAAGLRGVPFAAAYCASKGAVTLLTKAAAKEFATLRYPVRVNSVHPGDVESPMMDKNIIRLVSLGWAPSVEQAHIKVAEMNPLGRMARADEVANGIVFLCSSASSYMNGAEFVIDGGVTA